MQSKDDVFTAERIGFDVVYSGVCLIDNLEADVLVI